MFTFKKIALLGAASLVAFSMSCSDPAEEGSGSFNPEIKLGLDAQGSVVITQGTVVSDDPTILVKSVSATSNGKSLTVGLANSSALNAASVPLTGIVIGGVCAANSSTKNEELKVKVIATFSDATTIESENKIKVDCSTQLSPGGDPALVKQPIALSNAGNSFADLDNNTGYGIAAAAGLKSKIDLVAFYGEVNINDGDPGNGDGLYSPYALDFFYSEDYSTYYGSPTSIIKLPSPTAAFTLLNNAQKVSDLNPFLGELLTVIDDTTNYVTYAPATPNTAFLVSTTEEDLKAVLVTSTGTKSVNLNSISMPEE